MWSPIPLHQALRYPTKRERVLARRDRAHDAGGLSGTGRDAEPRIALIGHETRIPERIEHSAGFDHRFDGDENDAPWRETNFRTRGFDARREIIELIGGHLTERRPPTAK